MQSALAWGNRVSPHSRVETAAFCHPSAGGADVHDPKCRNRRAATSSDSVRVEVEWFAEAFMHRDALCRLILGLTLALPISACSGDDNSPTPSAAAGSGGAAGRTQAGSGGSSGASANNGSAKEGEACDTSSDCSSGLSCVISGIPQGTQILGAQVCARACTHDSDCMTAEFCQTITGKGDDLHCWNEVDEALQPCGPSTTSQCADNLDCLLIGADGAIPLGLCFNECTLPTRNNPDPGVVLDSCSSGLNCIDAFGDPDVGLCAKGAALGDDCDLGMATVCSDSTALCVGDDPTSSAGVCFEDCTTSKMCSDSNKTCMAIPNDQDGTSFCR
jgi:hypothetical protein